MRWFDQGRWSVRFEWDLPGVTLAGQVVVVDVLSFSTAVDVAVGRGAIVTPHGPDDGDPAARARELGAIVAGKRGAGLSLSPASLERIPAETRLLLPSPNGSRLCAAAAQRGRVIAGCLRNASVVARACGEAEVVVVAAGERWPDGSLRPALEDLIGAGAILSGFAPERLSPEARSAVAAYRGTALDDLRACASALELFERGFAEDVEIAFRLDASDAVPELRGGAFTA